MYASSISHLLLAFNHMGPCVTVWGQGDLLSFADGRYIPLYLGAESALFARDIGGGNKALSGCSVYLNASPSLSLFTKQFLYVTPT